MRWAGDIEYGGAGCPHNSCSLLRLCSCYIIAGFFFSARSAVTLPVTVTFLMKGPKISFFVSFIPEKLQNVLHPSGWEKQVVNVIYVKNTAVQFLWCTAFWVLRLTQLFSFIRANNCLKFAGSQVSNKKAFVCLLHKKGHVVHEDEPDGPGPALVLWQSVMLSFCRLCGFVASCPSSHACFPR